MNLNNKIRRRSVLYLFLCLYIIGILLIFASSLQTGAVSGGSSQKLTTFIKNLLEWLTFHKWQINVDVLHLLVRKLIGHYGSFLFIGLCGYIVYALIIIKLKRALFVSMSVGFIISMIAEILQLFSDGRSAQISDMIIDYLGYLSGTLIGLFIIYRVIKKQKDDVNHRLY